MIDQNEKKQMVKGFLGQSLSEACKDLSLEELAQIVCDSLHHDEYGDFERIIGAEINKRRYGKQNI